MKRLSRTETNQFKIFMTPKYVQLPPSFSLLLSKKNPLHCMRRGHRGEMKK